jgi:hypothetical protein
MCCNYGFFAGKNGRQKISRLATFVKSGNYMRQQSCHIQTEKTAGTLPAVFRLVLQIS